MADFIDRLRYIIGIEDEAAAKALGGISKAIIGIGAAYMTWTAGLAIAEKAIGKSVEMEATMKSLRAVTEATGRDYVKVLAAMEGQVGGLASRAVVASGMLKGMTTELDVAQIDNLTTAIRDASIAMGEDFATQFPLIVKAIKQLNPAILDNIGVTVRLDQVNKKIREGYYGLNTEISEATQQNAIYHEIMKQTAKFRGQEAALLDTAKGKYLALTAATDDMLVSLGDLVTQSSLVRSGLDGMLGIVKGLTSVFQSLQGESLETWISTNQAMSEQHEQALTLAERYEMLSEKTARSTAEQTELNNVMEQLIAINPDIVTAWDETGRAIDISTTALRKHIEVEKAIQAVEFTEHLREVKERYDDIISSESKHPDIIRKNLELFVQRRAEYQKQLAELAELGDTSSEEYKRAEYGVESWTNVINANVETLRTQKEELDKLAPIASAMLPDLKIGTEQWKIAVQLLGEQLATMIVDYQTGLETIGIATGTQISAEEKIREEILKKIEAHRTAQEELKRYHDILREELGIVIPEPDFEEELAEEEIHIESRKKLQRSLYAEMLDLQNQSRSSIIDTESEIAAYRAAMAIKSGTITRAQAAAFMASEREKLRAAAETARQIQSIMGSAMSRIVDQVFEGKLQLRDIFKSMAQDFIKYFVTTALNAVSGGFVGGLVSIIGSIFDTHANDLVAMEQGRHIGQFMTQGLRDELESANLGGMITDYLGMNHFTDYAPYDRIAASGQTVNIIQLERGSIEEETLIRRTANQLVDMAEMGDVPLMTETKVRDLLGISGGSTYGN